MCERSPDRTQCTSAQNGAICSRGMSRSKGVGEAPEGVRAQDRGVGGAAWGAAFRRYHHRVGVTLVASGVPADRAVDLAQQAWMRLIEQDDAGRLTEIRLPGLAVAQARLL